MAPGWANRNASEFLTADGLNVVKSAKDAGVDLYLVNIMAMDYGRSGQDYGDLAIQAVKSTKDQIKSIYGNSDAAAFKMVGVTPMNAMHISSVVCSPQVIARVRLPGGLRGLLTELS